MGELRMADNGGRMKTTVIIPLAIELTIIVEPSTCLEQLFPARVNCSRVHCRIDETFIRFGFALMERCGKAECIFYAKLLGAMEDGNSTIKTLVRKELIMLCFIEITENSHGKLNNI